MEPMKGMLRWDWRIGPGLISVLCGTCDECKPQPIWIGECHNLLPKALAYFFSRHSGFQHSLFPKTYRMRNEVAVTCPAPRRPRAAPGHGKKVSIVPAEPSSSAK
jgi:hypothetical protein